MASQAHQSITTVASELLTVRDPRDTEGRQESLSTDGHLLLSAYLADSHRAKEAAPHTRKEAHLMPTWTVTLGSSPVLSL